VTDAPTAVADLPSGRIEYRLVPGGPDVVVLFHGGHLRAGLPLGEDALVAAGYTVLVPSRPGYGRTPLWSQGSDPTDCAARTAKLCRHLGLEQVAAVVGVSAGAPTAVALAVREGPRVRSLVLQSARSSLPWPEGATRALARVAFRAPVERVPWALTHVLVRRAPDVGLRLMMGSLSTLPPGQVVADLTGDERQRLRTLFAGMRSGRGFANDLRQRVDPAQERAVTQPTLIVRSPWDGQVGPAHARQLHESIPGSSLFESQALSHLVWFGPGAAATEERTLEFVDAHR
jgi:pimeloyl-ACP methyl ester carboxylesterase